MKATGIVHRIKSVNTIFIIQYFFGFQAILMVFKKIYFHIKFCFFKFLKW